MSCTVSYIPIRAYNDTQSLLYTPHIYHLPFLWLSDALSLPSHSPTLAQFLKHIQTHNRNSTFRLHHSCHIKLAKCLSPPTKWQELSWPGIFWAQVKTWPRIKGCWAAVASLFTRDKTWIYGMIWLVGLLNRASNPAMIEPVNPYTMRLCLAVSGARKWKGRCYCVVLERR